MMTRPPAPDDGLAGNGRLNPAAADGLYADPFEAQRARMSRLWELALRRFRDYVHRGNGRDWQKEDT
jgi:hypothetical protein